MKFKYILNLNPYFLIQHNGLEEVRGARAHVILSHKKTRVGSNFKPLPICSTHGWIIMVYELIHQHIPFFFYRLNGLLEEVRSARAWILLIWALWLSKFDHRGL